MFYWHYHTYGQIIAINFVYYHNLCYQNLVLDKAEEEEQTPFKVC